MQDQVIFLKIKELFFDIDWLNYSEPFTYRFEIQELCIKFLELKNEIEQLLEEEKKGYGTFLNVKVRGKKELCVDRKLPRKKTENYFKDKKGNGKSCYQEAFNLRTEHYLPAGPSNWYCQNTVKGIYD